MSVLVLAAAVLVALTRAQEESLEDLVAKLNETDTESFMVLNASVAELFPPDHSLFNRTGDYLKYMVEMEKLPDYLVVDEDTDNSSGNLSAINTSFYMWHATDLWLPQLNEEYQYNVSVYVNDTSGNLTFSGTELIFGCHSHTSFSDWTDEQRKHFLGLTGEAEGQVAEAEELAETEGCVTLYTTRQYVTNQEGGDLECGRFWFENPEKEQRKSWALAAVRSRYCVPNVTFPYHKQGGYPYVVQGAVCELVLSLSVPLLDPGTNAEKAAEHLLKPGMCYAKNFRYPDCLGKNDRCGVTPYSGKLQCFIYNPKSTASEQFVAASAFLRGGHTSAIVMTVYMSTHFQQHYTGKNKCKEAPVTGETMCDKNYYFGVASVTAIYATSKWSPDTSLLVVNTWGAHWGAQGRFWLSLGAFNACFVPGSNIVFYSNQSLATQFGQNPGEVLAEEPGNRTEEPGNRTVDTDAASGTSLAHLWALLVLAVAVWLP